jgi:enoyl-CoA hydratase/carnithine racemase
MPYETLDLRREGAVLWCTLDRPEALNTFNAKFVAEFHDLLDALADDPATRIVVLRGAGRAFCAGLDLKETGAGGDGSVSGSLRGQQRISQIALKMRRLPQVFLACVHGPACGGGFMLALASDIRIAGASARMNAAFIKLGLSGCDVGVSYLLPRLVGASVASELILTGRFLPAERARELGLVAAVVPDEGLEDEARSWIADLLRTTPLGLRLSKETLNASLDMGSLEAVVAMEDRNQVLAARSKDFGEGVRAFLEKREPVFHDR